MLKTIFIGYLILMSLFTLFLFGIDKQKARHHKRRIPELRLIFYALAGGSIGALLGIYLFRHKTLHLKSTLGIPIILCLQTAFILCYFHGFF